MPWCHAWYYRHFILLHYVFFNKKTMIFQLMIDFSIINSSFEKESQLF